MDMNIDGDPKEVYFSYLLRIWRLEYDARCLTSKQNLYRVSIENTRNRTRVMFTNLEDLFCFLQDQMKQKDQVSKS